MVNNARPKMLFLVSGIWFSIALLRIWLSRDWLRMEHQAWGPMTVVALLPVIGWFVPLPWAFVRLQPRVLKL